MSTATIAATPVVRRGLDTPRSAALDRREMHAKAHISAVFTKQYRDTLKNPAMLIQFVLFPVMAFLFTHLVASSDYFTMDGTMFLVMFASMFAGSAPLQATSAAIAEDRDTKSLRLLVIAGVKPGQYLLGVGGFYLALSLAVSGVFGWISGFEGAQLAQLVGALALGSAASMVLGACIGVAAKNAQAAGAIATPLFMVLAFAPMIGQFDERVARIAQPLFTQQIDTIINNAHYGLTRPFAIIAANAVVFTTLFVIAYRKKGLRS